LSRWLAAHTVDALGANLEEIKKRGCFDLLMAATWRVSCGHAKAKIGKLATRAGWAPHLHFLWGSGGRISGVVAEVLNDGHVYK